MQYIFSAMGMLAALLGMFVVSSLTSLTLISSWLISINVVAFLVYGFDKFQAGRMKFRVPERTLLFLSLLGGSLGALIAQRVFHHKTKRPKFQFIGWLIVLAQVGVLLLVKLV